jgi:hypothetical protein
MARAPYSGDWPRGLGRHEEGLERADLDRFAFLLGGNDGEPLFQPRQL